MNIINSSVAVPDISLLQFFFPNFVVCDSVVPFYDGGVIFTGDKSKLQRLRELGIPYICLSKTPEFDLTNRDVLFEFVYSKWGKSVPKYVTEYLQTLDEKAKVSEYINLVKQVWVTGKCSINEKEQQNLFTLIENIEKSSMDGVKCLFNVADKINTKTVQSFLINFLYKAQRFDEIKDSMKESGYKKSVSTFSKSSMIVNNIPHAIENYLYSEHKNEVLKIAQLILDLYNTRR